MLTLGRLGGNASLRIGITANVGFLLAQSASYGLQLMGDESMDAWGWRLPFLVAVVPGTIATVGRRCMPESGLFLEAREAVCDSEASEVSSQGGACEACGKMRALVRSHWANILVGIGGVVAPSVLQYGGFAWCSVRLQKEGTEAAILLSAGVVARVSAIVFVPLAAWLADLQGVAWLHLVGAMMLTLFGMPLYVAMLQNYTSFEAVVGAYGLGALVLRKRRSARRKRAFNKWPCVEVSASSSPSWACSSSTTWWSSSRCPCGTRGWA